MTEFRTVHGHRHAEAFMLMTYSCRCTHRIVIWNSRDGVTPFSMTCPKCKRPDMYHVEMHKDVYAPKYNLLPGQHFWRDGTDDEALDTIKHRIEYAALTPDIFETKYKPLFHAGGFAEFAAGWPKLDTFGARAA